MLIKSKPTVPNVGRNRMLKCDNCGKPFSRPLYKRVGAHDYCSRSCSMKATNAKRALENELKEGL